MTWIREAGRAKAAAALLATVFIAGCGGNENGVPTDEPPNTLAPTNSATNTTTNPVTSTTPTTSDPAKQVSADPALANMTVTSQRGYQYEGSLLSFDVVSFPDDPGFTVVEPAASVELTNRSGQSAPESVVVLYAYYTFVDVPFEPGTTPRGALLLSAGLADCVLPLNSVRETVDGVDYCRVPVASARVEGLADGATTVAEPNAATMGFAVRSDDAPAASELLRRPAWLSLGVNEDVGSTLGQPVKFAAEPQAATTRFMEISGSVEVDGDCNIGPQFFDAEVGQTLRVQLVVDDANVEPTLKLSSPDQQEFPLELGVGEITLTSTGVHAFTGSVGANCSQGSSWKLTVDLLNK